MTPLTIDPAVAELIVACLALLFGTAALHKLRDLRAFTEIFAAYEILPGLARAQLTSLVPVLEAAVAAGLLFDVTRASAAVAGALLLLAYAAAIAVNLARGRRDLACGCGAPDERRPIAPWMLGRNLLIGAVAGVLLLPWSPRSLEPTDAVTIGLGTLTCALVYLCLERLLGRNAPRSAELRRT
ncbi:MAG TPA: MauE/DoxX family redox-associated membrane protein [Steroidobacteraceae bacterium]|jgi:uncharacterized membrane protein YphA (DoxX/SURF4 family)